MIVVVIVVIVMMFEIIVVRVIVVEAESNVDNFRRVMKNWYRNVRSFASKIAPELYFYLPDLLWSGSLLGDGGFAKFGNITAKRQLTEYTNLTSMANVTSTRHLLLKGNHQDKEVILKGFNMLQPTQRNCLEREIRILGMLSSEFIISPNAIVDDVTNQLDNNNTNIQSALKFNQYRGIIFLEYPFYTSGNLKNWRLSSERSPWQIQSVI